MKVVCEGTLRNIVPQEGYFWSRARYLFQGEGSSLPAAPSGAQLSVTHSSVWSSCSSASRPDAESERDPGTKGATKEQTFRSADKQTAAEWQRQREGGLEMHGGREMQRQTFGRRKTEQGRAPASGTCGLDDLSVSVLCCQRRGRPSHTQLQGWVVTAHVFISKAFPPPESISTSASSVEPCNSVPLLSEEIFFSSLG